MNYERDVFALLAGVRHKTASGAGNVEHGCIGSTGFNSHVNYCGDFSALAWDGVRTGNG